MALRRGSLIEGDKSRFSLASKQSLQKARGTVLTGYGGNEDLRETIEDIVELATTLRDEMAKLGSEAKKKTRAK